MAALVSVEADWMNEKRWDEGDRMRVGKEHVTGYSARGLFLVVAAWEGWPTINDSQEPDSHRGQIEPMGSVMERYYVGRWNTPFSPWAFILTLEEKATNQLKKKKSKCSLPHCVWKCNSAVCTKWLGSLMNNSWSSLKCKHVLWGGEERRWEYIRKD